MSIDIEVKNLVFKYPDGRLIFKGLTLSVSRGEHVLIIGDTGSGKTTLARVLSKTGEIIYGGEAAGEIKLLGKRLEEIEIEELQRILHVIGQNPYLYFSEYTVRNELYGYALKIYRNQEHANRAVKRAVETLSINHLLDRYFYELSGGEARRVAVARSLIVDPQILVFDEPLMWLDDKGVLDFLDVLRLLRSLGKTVVVFEHRFLPIVRFFDKVYMLHNGRLYDVTETMWNLLKKTTHDPGKTNVVEKPRSESKTLIELSSVKHWYNNHLVLKGVDLVVRSNDIVLIYGLNGSGKTTLLKIIAGYIKPKAGIVYRNSRILYIPQNIVLFFTEESVRGEVESICRAWKQGQECISEGVERIVKLGIPLDKSPFTLSHGQMVKLAVTIASLARADLILLDEPFSGLTYRDRAELMRFLQLQNRAFILATSTIDAVSASPWTRIYKLEEGRLVEFTPSSSISMDYAAAIYEGVKHGVYD